MFDIQNYLSFITAIVLFQIAPGPGTVTILSATARHGVRAGMGAVLGTLLGDFLFMLAAVAGLAAILQAHPIVLKAAQWIGAGYLIVLGIQTYGRTEVADVPSPEGHQTVPIYFQQALTVSLMNPKVVLFFMAFFPLFLYPDASWITLLIMMLHVTLLSLLYQTALVWIGHEVARSLNALPGIQRLTNRLVGMAFVGFGLKLALDQS